MEGVPDGRGCTCSQASSRDSFKLQYRVAPVAEVQGL